MRWGWTSLSPKEFIGWDGWGYRKIVAKHGWGPTARAKTGEALLETRPEPRGIYVDYVGPPYDSRSGRLGACEWLVSQAMPMGGIITAHGRYVRPG